MAEKKLGKHIYKLNIKELPKEILPREKALKYGIDTLSDFELLALILGKGTKKLNVLALAKKILKDKSIKKLSSISFEDLKSIDGIGEAKALQILAIGEIIKRIEELENKRISFNSPSDVFNYVKHLSKDRQEKMLVLYTNTLNELLGEEIVAVGSLNVLSVQPRDIFFPAIKYNAYGLILVHNHPNGNPYPSKEDIQFTNLVKELADKLGFTLLDHIIVGKREFYSFLNDNNL